jgi:hypothetical protein
MATIKAVVGILVIVFAIYACFQIAPPMMANYSFRDDLRTVALMDSGSLQKTEDDVREDVLKRAREHELPIDAKQITVQRINTPGVSAVYVAVDYSVPVNLPGYSFDLHFTPDSGNK